MAELVTDDCQVEDYQSQTRFNPPTPLPFDKHQSNDCEYERDGFESDDGEELTADSHLVQPGEDINRY